MLATPKPIPLDSYHGGGQQLAVATGNATSIGVVDNDCVGQSAFGLQDGHNPTVWRSTQIADARPVGTMTDAAGTDAASSAAPSAPGGAYVVGDIDGLQGRAQQRWDNGGSQECVGLVQGELPEIGQTKTWREGAKITRDNPPDLEPGTVIATFVNGQYPQSGTGRHAAVFKGYHRDQDGNVDGINVIDQWNKQAPWEHPIYFNPAKAPQNNAGAFSVLRRP